MPARSLQGLLHMTKEPCTSIKTQDTKFCTSCEVLLAYELLSKLLVSPLITPIVVPYIIPYITPIKEFRL